MPFFLSCCSTGDISQLVNIGKIGPRLDSAIDVDGVILGADHEAGATELGQLARPRTVRETRRHVSARGHVPYIAKGDMTGASRVTGGMSDSH